MDDLQHHDEGDFYTMNDNCTSSILSQAGAFGARALLSQPLMSSGSETNGGRPRDVFTNRSFVRRNVNIRKGIGRN